VGDVTSEVSARLLSSAARVLDKASGSTNGEMRTPAAPGESPADRLWNVTLAVTALRAQSDELRSIDEAVAALQLASSTLSGSAAVPTDGSAVDAIRVRLVGTRRCRETRGGDPASAGHLRARRLAL